MIGLSQGRWGRRWGSKTSESVTACEVHSTRVSQDGGASTHLVLGGARQGDVVLGINAPRALALDISACTDQHGHFHQ